MAWVLGLVRQDGSVGSRHDERGAVWQVWKDGVRIEYFEGASEEKLEQLFTKYLHMSSSENPTANA